MFKKYLYEPLLHFLLIGGLIFAFYSWQNDATVDDNTILMTQAEITQLNNRYEKKHLRPPSAKEKQEFIDKAIYTKVMYREALKIGLDNNDLIIRRRLAQKMEFVSRDMAQLVEPTDKELLAYLQENTTKFMNSPKISFMQIYINPNRHKGNLEKDLNEILALLHNSDINSTFEKISDPFMLPVKHSNLSKEEVVRNFGKVFSKKLFTLEENKWHKAVKSGYGLHFVFIQNKEEEKLRDLEEVRILVYNEWMTKKREETNILFYENLKNNYNIVIQESSK